MNTLLIVVVAIIIMYGPLWDMLFPTNNGDEF